MAMQMGRGIVHVSHSIQQEPSSTSQAVIISQSEQDAMAKARVGNMNKNGMPVQDNNMNNNNANANHRACGTQAPSITPGAVHVSGPSDAIMNSSSVTAAPPGTTQEEMDVISKYRARRAAGTRRHTPYVTPTPGVTTMSQQEQADYNAKQQARAPGVVRVETTVAQPTQDMDMVSPMGPQTPKDNTTQAEQDILAKKNGSLRSVAVGATTYSAPADQGGAPPVVSGVVSVSGVEAQEVDGRVHRKEERAERRENRRAGEPVVAAAAATRGVIVGAHAYASSEPSVEQIKTQQGGVVHSAQASAPSANGNPMNPLYASSAAMSAEERRCRIDAKFAQVDREDAARADKMEEVHSDKPPTTRTSHNNSIAASKEFELYPQEPAISIQIQEIAPIVSQQTLAAAEYDPDAKQPHLRIVDSESTWDWLVALYSWPLS
jgi:hypothetical protein